MSFLAEIVSFMR